MTRRSISKATRVRIFLAAEGKCHLCGLRIDALKQAWEVEHVKPLSMGGTDTDANLKPAHIHCHKEKSAEEAAPRAKADRAGAKHLRLAKPSQIRSAGFAPRAAQKRASAPLMKQLPPRRHV